MGCIFIYKYAIPWFVFIFILVSAGTIQYFIRVFVACGLALNVSTQELRVWAMCYTPAL
jgi:hypothetical protein